MKVSIIIPNFNGRLLLKKNIPKIIKYCGVHELIIVDDASTDGSVQEVKNITENIKIIQNKKNEGFAYSVNRGVEESNGDLVVLLNTDVYPEKEFLDSALPHFKDSQVFAVGFLQKSIEGSDIVLRGRGVGKFEGGFLVHDRGEVDKSSTLWVSGGASVFRKSIWDKLGGMSTLYNPFYWEDIDFSYRALKAGYKLIFEPKSVVYHEQQAGAIRSFYTSSQIKKIAYRNQIFFVWCNITDWSLVFQHLLFIPYHIIRSFITGDLAFIYGFILAFIKLPYILRKRQQYSKLFLLTDKDILLYRVGH